LKETFMNFHRSHHVLRAPEDGGNGAGAGAPPPPSGDGGATPPPPPAGGATPPPPPQGTALGAGATPPGAPPAPPPPSAPDPVFGVIPEKFRVKNDDGTPNLEASWLKVEEHRANLERRMGAGEAPPKAAADYKLDLPEKIAEALGADGQKQLAESEPFKAFTERLHGLGLSQKQYASVVAEMIERGMALRQGTAGLDAKDCTAELQKDWSDQAVYDKNVQAAYAASKTFGDVDKLMAKYGNDPDFIRFAAKVGAELHPDTSASAGASAAGQGEKDEHAALSSWLHSNPTTAPEYEAKRARYNALGEKIWGTGAKAPGSMAFGTLG
jgi:hypothetical protein